MVDPETHRIDRERLSLAYFQRLDRQIRYAMDSNVFYGVEVLYDNSTFRKQEWANHPYNERNGGWIADWDAATDEYTTDQLPFGWGIRKILDLKNVTHMSYLKRMVSYLVARTSAYWNVFYAMGCETSNIYPGQANRVDRWYTLWGDFMASIDPHGRLLTIGDVGSRDDVPWDDIDPKTAFVYANARNNLITTQEHSISDDIHEYAESIHRFGLRFWKYRRPTVIGEQDGRNNNKYWKERRGYWVAFVSGYMMGRVDRHYELADGDRLRESTLFGFDDDPAVYRYMEYLANFVEEGHVNFWRMSPLQSVLVDPSRSIYCLGEFGRQYVIYFVAGGSTGLSVSEGTYRIRWFNPREGAFVSEEIRTVGQDNSPILEFKTSDAEDWVLEVQKTDEA